MRIARSEKLSLSAFVTRHRKAFYQRDGAVFIAASLSTTVFHLEAHPVFLRLHDEGRFIALPLIIARSKPRRSAYSVTRDGTIIRTITGSARRRESLLPRRVSKPGREERERVTEKRISRASSPRLMESARDAGTGDSPLFARLRPGETRFREKIGNQLGSSAERERTLRLSRGHRQL